MRKADYDVAWRECRKSEGHRIWLDRIKARLPDDEYDILVSSLMSAIIGPNGAGKTGFLKALSSLISGNNVPNSRHELLAVHGKFQGSNFEISADAATPSVNLVSEFIDASLEVHEIQNCIGRQQDIDDLVQQAGIGNLNDKAISLYSYVCNRNYTSIGISEIDAPARPMLAEAEEEEAVFPFFVVELDGIKYDSRTMGFGELCAFYIIWRANRANKGSILLFDEPDSHLSPAARRALLDVLAYLAHSRELHILFSSHAVESLHVMSENEMLVILSENANIPPRIAPVSTKRNVIRALGLTQTRRLLIVVEDVDAKEVVQQILNRWGEGISSSIDVRVVHGGATEVCRFLNLFPTDSAICRAMAVLDGDKMNTYQGQTGIVFLPSEHDPIYAARLSIVSNSQQFANLLGVELETLKSAIHRIAHVNHHDFCSDLKDELNLEGVEVSRVRSALICTWLNTPVVATAAIALAHHLTEQVDLIPIN